MDCDRLRAQYSKYPVFTEACSYCLRNKRLLTSPLLYLQDYERWHSVFFSSSVSSHLPLSFSHTLSLSLAISLQTGQQTKCSVKPPNRQLTWVNGVPTFPVCPVRAAFFHLILSFLCSLLWVFFFFFSAVAFQVNQFYMLSILGSGDSRREARKQGFPMGLV